MKPRIAITLGDPAGIGPEIVTQALRDPRVRRACTPIVVGTPRRVPMGRPSREAGLLAIEALRRGLLLVQTGEAQALVTAPVSKESFRQAHLGFPGHTEWLAGRCHIPHAAMLMVAGPLRAILMTRHVPLKDVGKHLTREVILTSARLGYEFVKKYVCPHPASGHPPEIWRTGPALPSPSVSWERVPEERVRVPRLVLCGLNPHAGDHGLIGKEEKTIFLAAIRALKRKGVRLAGPLPSDTVFSQMAEGHYDLALAAYHDQGMIPLKLYAPERVVNITLGLPFIRTSPGHGTAYDIAGKGKADARPMMEAILLAAQYCRARERGSEGARER